MHRCSSIGRLQSEYESVFQRGCHKGQNYTKNPKYCGSATLHYHEINDSWCESRGPRAQGVSWSWTRTVKVHSTNGRVHDWRSSKECGSFEFVKFVQVLKMRVASKIRRLGRLTAVPYWRRQTVSLVSADNQETEVVSYEICWYDVWVDYTWTETAGVSWVRMSMIFTEAELTDRSTQMNMSKDCQRRDTHVSFQGNPCRLRHERGAEMMASGITERDMTS